MHLLSPTLAVLWLGGLVVGSIQTSGNTHRQHSSSNHHQRAAATVNILHESHESNHGRPYSPPPYTYIAGCKELLRRKEWYLRIHYRLGRSSPLYRRFMTNSEKMDFIGAVKCLQSLPAKNPIIPQARTRFDEFQAQHIYVANNVHVVVGTILLDSISLTKRKKGPIPTLAPVVPYIVRESSERRMLLLRRTPVRLDHPSSRGTES